jgi:hypothetical protein
VCCCCSEQTPIPHLSLTIHAAKELAVLEEGKIKVVTSHLILRHKPETVQAMPDGTPLITKYELLSECSPHSLRFSTTRTFLFVCFPTSAPIADAGTSTPSTSIKDYYSKRLPKIEVGAV